jgi:hypothetical protein
MRKILLASLLAAYSLTSQAATSACDRACLEGMAEKYLAGMLAHDPSKAPIAKSARYTENAVTLPLPDGLWRTVDSIGKYRLYVSDPQQGQIGFFAKGTENGAPVLIATRLKVVNGQITEIESYAPRLTDTITAGPSSVKRTDRLGDTPRPQFLTALPPDKRLSRQKLASIANSYWAGLENNRGEKVPPFADECLRLENGTQTSGVEVAPGAKRTTINMKCAESFALGYYREDTRMRSRRMLVIDEERGLVYAGCFFDHDATVRQYQVKDGTTRTVTNTGPWTWGTHEIFQITADGKIGQVEAVLLAVPYGQLPGWDDGLHFPSEQAKKDGFKEF